MCVILHPFTRCNNCTSSGINQYEMDNILLGHTSMATCILPRNWIHVIYYSGTSILLTLGELGSLMIFFEITVAGWNKDTYISR